MLQKFLNNKTDIYVYMWYQFDRAFIKGEGIKILSYNNSKVLLTIATMSSLGTLLATTEEFLLVTTFSFRWCYSESIVTPLIYSHVFFNLNTKQQFFFKTSEN